MSAKQQHGKDSRSGRQHAGGLHMPKRILAIGFPSWVGLSGLAIAVAISYFLGARLSLALLTEPDGVAVFWPAAGIASGILIALGRSARLPVAVGVMVATVTANLLGDRNIASAIMFALCNAGEAMIIAWLVEYHFGPGFSLDSPRRVLGLFLATTVGTAISGIGGTAVFILFHGSEAPILTTWLNWFASDAIGVVTVAPLVIGLARTLHDLPEKSELLEGALALVVLALVSAIGFGSSTHYWFTILPLSLLFPVLLWPPAHCRPVFAAAAAFILALAIVWTITFGIGRLGDPSISLADRVHAAEVALLAISACALVLAALFAERRRNEVMLKSSNDRLQLALDCAELGIWSLHLKTGHFENDARDRHIHGYGTEAPSRTLAEMRSQIHPDDIANLDAAFAALSRAGRSCRAEYRLAPRTDQECRGRERWVAIEGAVERQANGQAVQLLGVTHDITEQKHAAAKLQESERESRERLGALPAAVYVTDEAGRITYCNQSAVDLWGVKPKLGEDKWCDLARYYHPNGVSMALDDCPTEIALRQGRIERGREAILERLDGTRIPIIPYPTPLRDATGTVVGVTERKEAERALAERNVQLALAGKAGLVGTYAHGVDTEMMHVSEGYAAIHGLPEGTTESSRSEWKRRVHPEDLPLKLAVEREAFRQRRGEYGVEYRIVRHGEIRWVESRGFILYDDDGNPQRITGVNIDITERKRAEEHQRVLVAELDHRVKNVLATVSAVAGQTLETSSSMSHFVAALDGRIRSMATAHELLSTRRWKGVPMADLIRRELAAYATSNNTRIDGPEITLSAEASQAMAMVIHELVTNAVKHGALSTKSGQVSVRWYRKLNGSAQLVLVWQETGGPRVEAPKTFGYGTGVVRDLIPYEFGGTVDLSFASEGVRCRLEIPFDRVSTDSRSRSGSERLHHTERSSSVLVR
jgi:PAS domain S-box-containing protein